MLLIHHLLEHSRSINARHIVIFECRHKWHCTSGNHKMLSINVSHLACDDILDSHATAFKEIPHCSVQENTLMVVARQSLRDVETTHSTEFLLFLKEEELVCLHVELTADISVVVNDYITDTERVKLLAACKSGRTRPDNGDLCFVNLNLTLLLFLGIRKHIGLIVDWLYLLHAIN